MRKIMLAVWLLSWITVMAQNECHNTLYEANKLYEAGHFQEAVNSLESCVMQHKLSKSEQFDATRLLALSYIYLDKSDSARIYISKMLKMRPHYQTVHYVDPKGLTTLLNEYTVTNRLSVGVHFGSSFNQVNIIKNFSTTKTPSTYIARIGFNAGGIAEYHFNYNLSLLSDININTMSYQRELDNIAGHKKLYTEDITTIEFPLITRYSVPMNKWKINLQAGGQINIWWKSFADVQSTSLNDGSVVQSSTETKRYRRNSIYGYQLGLGLSKISPKNHVTFCIGLRYKNYLPNVVLSEKRYDNVDFILNSQYIDSDFSLYSIGTSLSLSWPFMYSVREK